MSEHELGDSPQQVEAGQDAAEPGEKADSKTGSKANPAERTRRRGRPGAVAWLALVLAVGAIGLASQPYWYEWAGGEREAAGVTEAATPSAEEFKALSDRVERIDRRIQETAAELGQALENLKGEVEATGPVAQALSDRVDEIDRRLERLQGQHNTRQAGLRSRIEDLEEQVGRRLEQFELRLDDVGTDLDQTEHDLATRLRLVEIDSLFAFAQDQLAVSGDVRAARTAWQRGLERLTALQEAEFRTLKETARREFDKLQAFRPPDLAARLDRIYAIAGEVEQWPARSGQGQRQTGPEDSSGGWRDRLGALLDDLVQVESIDDDFVTPLAVDRAREQVRITLEAAALSLVRTDNDTARRLIQRALASVKRTFDTDAAGVEEAVTWLADLAAPDGQPGRPPSLEDSRAEITRLLGRSS